MDEVCDKGVIRNDMSSSIVNGSSFIGSFPLVKTYFSMYFFSKTDPLLGDATGF